MNEFEDDEESQEAFQEPTPELVELRRVFWRIHAVLDDMLARTPSIDANTPAALIAKLSDLQTAYRRLVAAEEAFNAQHTVIAHDAEPDQSAVRAEIGGKLDRIRNVITTERIPCDVDVCATCSAALSV